MAYKRKKLSTKKSKRDFGRKSKQKRINHSMMSRGGIRLS